MTAVDARERELLDVVAARLVRSALDLPDRDAVLAIVEDAVVSSPRRPQVLADAGATRVDPRLVARAVAAVVRPHLDPARGSAPVVLDEATVSQIWQELRERFVRVARPAG